MFIRRCREFSIPLIAGVVLAVVWANLAPESYHHIVHTPILGEKISLHWLVNDVFMVFFFAIAGVEIVNSLSPGGALNPMRKAVTPLMATAGGVIGPVVIFFILNTFMGSPEFNNGWGITTATDIALAWLLARLIFGACHPAVSFLLLLAVVDDGIGLAIIAIFYPDPLHPTEPIWLILVVIAMAIAFNLKRRAVLSYWPYILIAGLISWLGMYSAHLHPALSLVFIVPFLPSAGQSVPNHSAHGVDDAVCCSTLHKFEEQVSPFVDFGLLFFGLTNAGVEFAAMSNLTWIILIAIVLGKTLGISLFTYIALLLQFKLPEGMNKRDVVMAGLIGGMGLTVALFVAGAAFVDPILQGSAKMGALFTAGVFLLAFLVARILGIKKI
jgi:NhaA family Na+:H+ antiporter